MYNKILSPLDGSKLSECALEHVKAIAAGRQSAVVLLLTVLEPVALENLESANQSHFEEMSRQVEKTNEENQRKAEDYLDKAVKDLSTEGIAAQTVILSPQPAKGVAESILDYAHDNHVDLIIMSTHGRSGISRWAFGSVADRVVQNAKAPVLTITPKGCRG